MENLWAPWRSDYISNVDNTVECIFCRAAEEKDPLKVFRLQKTLKSIIILNLYPYNSGHAMVAPLNHEGSFENLSIEEISDINLCLQKLITIMKKKLNPDGFNIGANIGRVAGAGIPGHFHMHIVPRWSGDTNFMPVFGKTKIVSISPEEIWHKLADDFQ
ncbi:HIT domain-containing protein [candidate division WOR-3 bacterium]|nr:HIT domain-containing protein [candidate division WOR-3 bacterium]